MAGRMFRWWDRRESFIFEADDLSREDRSCNDLLGVRIFFRLLMERLRSREGRLWCYCCSSSSEMLLMDWYWWTLLFPSWLLFTEMLDMSLLRDSYSYSLHF